MPGIRCALSHIAEMPKLTWNAMTSARQTTSMPPAFSSSPRAKLVRLLGGEGAKAIWPAQRGRRCGYNCCWQRLKEGETGSCDLVTNAAQLSGVSSQHGAMLQGCTSVFKRQDAKFVMRPNYNGAACKELQ